jgi:hypothetical protein
MSVREKELDSAVAAGRQSRVELAGILAHSFRTDPTGFDPQRLERLGAVGLRLFLEKIGTGVALPVRLHGSMRPSPSGKRQEQRSSASGWKHLRRPEWPVWIAGILAGIRAGSVIVGAALVILFLVEKIAPLAWKVLS